MLQMIIHFDPPNSVEIYMDRRGQSGPGQIPGPGVIRGTNGSKEAIHVVSLIPYGVAGSSLMGELRSYRAKEQFLMPPPRVEPISSVCSIADVISHCAREASLVSVSDVRTEICHAYSSMTSYWQASSSSSLSSHDESSHRHSHTLGHSHTQGHRDSHSHRDSHRDRESEDTDPFTSWSLRSGIEDVKEDQVFELTPSKWVDHSMFRAPASTSNSAATTAAAAAGGAGAADKGSGGDSERRSSKHHSSHSSSHSPSASSSSSFTPSSSSSSAYHPPTSTSSYPTHPTSSSSSSSSSSSPFSSTYITKTFESNEVEVLRDKTQSEKSSKSAPVPTVIESYRTPSGFTIDPSSANAVLAQVT